MQQEKQTPMKKVHNFGWVTGEQFMKKLEYNKNKEYSAHRHWKYWWERRNHRGLF